MTEWIPGPRIVLDIDDTLADFKGGYNIRFDVFNHPERWSNPYTITRNVQQVLNKEKNFWLDLAVLHRIDFIPYAYCTKRVCPKAWTRKWLIDNGFPDRPIYQIYIQNGSKGRMMKGRADILIDDSISNVRDCLQHGIKAVLVSNPYIYDSTDYRLPDLKLQTILAAV